MCHLATRTRLELRSLPSSGRAYSRNCACDSRAESQRIAIAETLRPALVPLDARNLWHSRKLLLQCFSVRLAIHRFTALMGDFFANRFWLVLTGNQRRGSRQTHVNHGLCKRDTKKQLPMLTGSLFWGNTHPPYSFWLVPFRFPLKDQPERAAPF